MSDALKHVKLVGRENLTLDDVGCYMALNLERGAYFPHVHWDSVYYTFPEVDSFQLWFLVENEKDTGNMFMVETPEVASSLNPHSFRFQSNGSVLKIRDDGNVHEGFVEARYATLQETKMKFSYLDMKPGECMVMNPRTLHISDPRPQMLNEHIYRLAVNVRVIIKPRDASSLNIWPGNQWVNKRWKKIDGFKKPHVYG